MKKGMYLELILLMDDTERVELRKSYFASVLSEENDPQPKWVDWSLIGEGEWKLCMVKLL